MSSRRLHTTLVVLGSAWLNSSCALERGSGFSTLSDATLAIRMDPGAARDLGNDRVLTDQAYEVSIERAQVRVESLELQEVAGGGGKEDFDPANPPAGYGLCHSGHCHRDDGALVSYEDIEVELAGGSEAFTPLVTLSFDDPISLLASRATPADGYQPSRDLERSTPRRILVSLSRLEIEGTVSGGDLGDEEIMLSIDLPLAAGLATTLDGLTIDRDGPEEFHLRTTVTVDGTLFDDLDFSTLAEAGMAVLEDPDTAASETLVTSLSASETSVIIN